MTTSPHEQTPLPAPIRTYLDAHAAGDQATALEVFSPSALVTDQGHTFRGTEEIDGFLRDAGSEFTFTTEELGGERVDDQHWVVAIRLEGNFPGGIAELRYRFTIADDLVTELFIGA
jgi:hypothetical protein